MSTRRVSLPALRVSTPRALSPKVGYLKEISEFDVEPPFLSPSSSSSAENSPRMLSPIARPGSARPPRRRRVLSRSSCVEEDDVFPFRLEPIVPCRSADTSPRDVVPKRERPGTTGRPALIGQMQQMRSFNINSQGRIVDCGFQHSGVSTRPLTARNHKSRRATCPEIWLSSELEPQQVFRVALRVYGSETVGKETLIRQMSAYVDAAGRSDEILLHGDEGRSQAPNIKFLMNEKEIELEIIHGSGLGKDLFQEVPTVYMIVYSVDNRESYVRAAQTLFRIYDRKMKNPCFLLVGNKLDLQRKRDVSTIEGKMLAKIYKCGFIEVSALLSMNMEALWKEFVKRTQSHIVYHAKQEERRKRRSESRNRLASRIIQSGRRFAKSCEELVARIAAI